jgi:hypothetical protein
LWERGRLVELLALSSTPTIKKKRKEKERKLQVNIPNEY